MLGYICRVSVSSFRFEGKREKKFSQFKVETVTTRGSSMILGFFMATIFQEMMTIFCARWSNVGHWQGPKDERNA